MKTKEKLLLVASFLEGKNFPKKAKTQFVVEAKFDGEQLTTDPVDHNENLEINQELAWELDKKALQQHKLQRSVIKCTCFTIGNDLKKENVGYFVLDVRTTPEGDNKPKWYQLLQSKYGKMKPEMRVNLYIEGEQQLKKEISATTQAQRDTKIVKVDSPYKGGNQIDARKLRPVLVESEGYFSIGPESHKSETFVLSITIAFAKNLFKLVPSDFDLSEKGTFFFSYSLIGNQIISDSFKDILSSDLAAERASVRIHTTIDILKVYLNDQKPIEIFLCAHDDILLGKALLNIKELLKVDEKILDKRPLVVDEILNIESLKKVEETYAKPIMGIQLTLRKENVLLGSENTNQNEAIKSNRTPSISPIRQSNIVSRDESAKSPQQPRVHFREDLIKQQDRSRSSSIESQSKSSDKNINENNNNNNNSNNNDSISSTKTFDIPTKTTTAESNMDNRLVHLEQPQYNNQINEFSEEMQLKVAYELQVWKEAKEKEFEAYLKQLEVRKLRELAEAFKQRDKERELIFQKKVKENNDLETKLKNSLNELSKREKSLTSNEIQLTRLKSDLQREYEIKLNDLREASKRVQEQAEHQLSMQRIKCESLDDEISRLRKQVIEAERRYAEKDQEFHRYKERENSKPEVQLQSELNLLTIEKNGLERKLEACMKSKNHYKEQWINALQEIGNLKKRDEENAKAFLKKQQIELDHLRMKYLAAEESSLARSEEKQLESLRSELSKMKTTNSSDDMRQTHESIDSNMEDHIARLIEERDLLLKTGVYSTKDSLIIELDRQIRESMNQVKK